MSRKIAVILGLLLVMSLGLVAPAFDAARVSQAQEEETFALTIMHTNDTHAAHLPQSNGNGGVAIQAAVVKQIRAEAANSLLLDAGDRFTGTLFHTTYLGQDQIQIMNALGYDAMTLGNHEFDNGDDILAQFVGGIEFPIVAANLDVSASPVLAGLVQPYTILDVNGQQIGIIGLVTADTVNIASPGDELVFSDDYAGVANASAAELTAQGVNKIILLTHTGINVDQAFVGSLENIDVVIGGHSHTLLSNLYVTQSGEYPLSFTSPSEQPILYVTAGQYNQYMGRLDVEFDAAGVITDSDGDVILLSQYIAPDADMTAIVDELRVAVDELANTPIGATSEVKLEGDRTVCRVEECNLGNLIADALRAETGAQIAFMNGGGIRASIEAGDITLGQVLTVHPFGNTTATFELTGADVIAALENSVSQLAVVDGAISREGLAGRFLQVSGIRVTYDITLEAGSRVVSVEILGEDGNYSPIDPAATYTIAANNFIRTGGDGFTVLAENAINPYDFGRIDYEVTRDYMVSMAPINAAVEGRIIYVNAQPAPIQ